MIIVAILLLLFPSLAYAQNAMQTLANSMAPGTWAALSTTGFNNGDALRVVGGCVAGTITDYSDKGGGWTSSGTIIATGGIHFDPLSIPPNCNASPMVRFYASTNTWLHDAQSPWPSFDNAFVYQSGTSGSTGHNYHHDTIVGSDMYHRQYGTGKVMKYTYATNSWAQCTAIPGNPNVPAGALEYFPDRNSIVYFDGTFGVYELSIATNCTGSWTQRAGGVFDASPLPRVFPMGESSNQSRYSSACQCIVLGGGGSANPAWNGTRNIWRYNANGTFSQGATSPAGVDMSVPQSGSGTVFTVDPVTQKILIWATGNPGSTMYEYDPVANSWNTISRTAPSAIFGGSGVENVMAWPISTYGVNMIAYGHPTSGGALYLYKHAAGVADTTPPSVPGIATGTPVGSSQINLSWAASSDPESGVSSYQVDRCQGATCTTGFTQIATPTTNSYNDTKLTSQTAYRYRVRAVNGQGLISGNSTISAAITTGVADTTAPTVAVTDPPNTTPVSAGTAGTYTLVGTGTDNIGVVDVTLTNDRGGSYVVNTSGTSVSWNRAVNLFNGTNVITVISHDAEGNASASVTRTITTTITGPSLTPVPTATAPGATVNVAFANIASPTNRDWIGLYPVGAPDTFNPAYPWAYTVLSPNCTQANQQPGGAATTVFSGSCNLVMPAAGGSYNFRLFSNDAETNPLAVSATVTSTAVVDTQAPTTPTGLNAIAINNTINLSWIASSDNIGVTGYRVERSPAGCAAFVQVATPSVNTQIDSGLAEKTTYCYRVRATDAAGLLSGYSAIAQATTGTIAPGGGNFAQRCALPGVIRCFGFDTTADLGGTYGSNFGSFNNAGSSGGVFFTNNNGDCNGFVCPRIDNAVSASGGGSLQMRIPSGSVSGDTWFTNFSANLGTTFPTSGSDFYLQWRQRFNQAYIDTVYPGSQNEGSKQIIVSVGDAAGCTPSTGAGCRGSNQLIDFVIQDLQQRGYAQMYGNQSAQYQQFLINNGSDFELQFPRPAPGCLYGMGTNWPGLGGTCIGYYPDEWMTFKIHLHIGTPGTAGGQNKYLASRMQLQIAREGQASQFAIDWTGDLYRETAATYTDWGKLWFILYITGQSPSVHPDVFTWFDELIISAQDIPDPSTTPVTGPGITITSPTSNPTTTVNTATISLGGTIQ